MKCMIVEDEQMAVKVIESHLSQLEGLQLTAVYNNAMEAFTALQVQRVDILFLDIQMPKMSGISLLKSLKQTPHVILTTAHRDYAIEGYELDIVDYLLKPISFERFVKAISKIYRLEQKQPPTQHFSNASPSLLSEPFIYIKSDRHFVRVLLSSICYIESIKNHIRLVTTEQTIITLLSISEIEARLPEQHFLRIHRSYIIALDKIQRFCHTNVEIGENSLPIGRMYKQEVLRRLNAHLL